MAKNRFENIHKLLSKTLKFSCQNTSDHYENNFIEKNLINFQLKIDLANNTSYNNDESINSFNDDSSHLIVGVDSISLLNYSEDNLDDDSQQSNYDDYDDSIQMENGSKWFIDSDEKIDCKQYESIENKQKQIINLLKNFYQISMETKLNSCFIGKYSNELIFAHKSLLILDKELNLMQNDLYKSIMNNDDQEIKMNKDSTAIQCLTLKSITIKLREKNVCRIFLRNNIGCFLFGLIENINIKNHYYFIRELPLILIDSEQLRNSKNNNNHMITIPVNENINLTDHNVCIEFYFMFHPMAAAGNRKIKSFWSYIRQAFKNQKFSELSFDTRLFQLILKNYYNNNQLRPASLFQLLGQLNIDENCARNSHLKQFNRCTIFESNIAIDFESCHYLFN